MKLLDEVKLSTCWIYAIEYGDTSRLSDEDRNHLDEFMVDLESDADGSIFFDWSGDTEFCRDEISGMYADCEAVKIYEC